MTPFASGIPGLASARPVNATKASTHAITSRNDEWLYAFIGCPLLALDTSDRIRFRRRSRHGFVSSGCGCQSDARSAGKGRPRQGANEALRALNMLPPFESSEYRSDEWQSLQGASCGLHERTPVDSRA